MARTATADPRESDLAKLGETIAALEEAASAATSDVQAAATASAAAARAGDAVAVVAAGTKAREAAAKREHLAMELESLRAEAVELQASIDHDLAVAAAKKRIAENMPKLAAAIQTSVTSAAKSPEIMDVYWAMRAKALEQLRALRADVDAVRELARSLDADHAFLGDRESDEARAAGNAMTFVPPGLSAPGANASAGWHARELLLRVGQTDIDWQIFKVVDQALGDLRHEVDRTRVDRMP